MIKRLVIALVFCLVPSWLWAACPGTPGDCYTVNSTYDWTTIDADMDTIQTTINQVPDVNTVYTIHVPTGTATWTSREAGGTPCLQSAICINNRNIKLIGNGSANTIITDNSSYAGSESLIYIIPSTARASQRISGFRFNTHASNTNNIPVIKILDQSGNKSYGWRVDNNIFHYGPNGVGVIKILVFVKGYSYGLVDSNTVLAHGVHDLVLMANDEQLNTEPGTLATNDSGSTSWIRGASFDPSTDLDKIYVEGNSCLADSDDPTSLCAALVEGGAGNRYVARYNTLKDTYIGSHGPGQSEMGGLQGVSYNNAFIATDAPGQARVEILGGTGLSYNNTWSGSPTVYTIVGDQRTSPLGQSNPNHWMRTCDGTVGSPTNADIDVGTLIYGYPCGNQLGRGGGAFLSQVLMPVYTWNNTGATALSPNLYNGGTHPNQADHVQANRDYYDYNASFDGSQATGGVGFGLRSARPATCTTSTESGGGPAYWATDEKILYRCSATNTWTVHYTQATCPHPLAGLTGSCNSAVAGVAGYNIGGGGGGSPSIAIGTLITGGTLR